MARTRIVGHRGASAAVHENTLPAFARTAEVGAGWVELDVRRLADGTLVVHHDAEIGGAPLGGMSLGHARALASSLGFCIPTLEEALAFCGGRLGVDIELKELGTEADAVVLAHRYLDPAAYVWTSFHDRVVAGLKLMDPEVPAGLLLGHPRPDASLLRRLSELYPIDRLRACGADFAAPNWVLVQLGILRRLRAAGIPAWVWTVNDEAMIRRLLQGGVEAIITDLPEVGARLRDTVQDQGGPTSVRPAPTLLSA